MTTRNVLRVFSNTFLYALLIFILLPVGAVWSAPPPAIPSNLQAAAVSSAKISLSWTDNSTDETGFSIERSTSYSGTYSQIATVGANVTTYTDTGLFSYSPYYYRVRAFRSTTYSKYSNIAYAQTFWLSPPANLSAAALSPTQINLSWTDINYETRYDVERSISSSGPYSAIGSVGANVTTYSDTGLTFNTTYYYRVKSFDGTNYSTYSNVASAVSPSLTFSGVGVNTNTIDTAASQYSNIFFTINGSATVTLKIIPEKQGPAGTPVYQTSQACPAAGPYLFTWDGHDNTGKVVPDEAYLYILEAVNGAKTGLYSPAAPTGSGTISCSQGTGFDAYRNDPLTINYSVSRLSRVDLSVNLSGYVSKVMASVPHVPGNYSFDWNGRSADGRILAGGVTAQCAVASLLRENVIITSGNTPKVTQLKTNPYDIQLSYGEFTRITYTLSRNANVTVTLIPATGSAITLINGQSQTAGAHEIQWDGIDLSDTSGKKLLLSQEGNYTVSIQAVNPDTGASSVTQGCLRVRR